jgi:anti-sigma28 factor (negative regulator of flagellin synthesis)
MCPLQRPAPLKNNTHGMAAADDATATHRAKLERLRQALSNGTYRPQAQLIAARLLTSGDLA